MRSEDRSSLMIMMTIDSIAATWFQNRFAVAEIGRYPRPEHVCMHVVTSQHTSKYVYIPDIVRPD